MTQQFIVTSNLKDEDLYKDLEKYAKDNTRSISFVVRKAIEEFLNKKKLKNTK